MKSIIFSILILISLFNLASIVSGQDCPDDGNPCTQELWRYDQCIHLVYGGCEGTDYYRKCVDGCKKRPEYNPCSSVSCDYITMECQYGRQWNGCDDDNKCTNEYCNSTVGCIRTNKDCSDGKASTIDNCNSLFGCYYTVNKEINGVSNCWVNSDCNDGRECTTDTCISNKCYYETNCEVNNFLCGSDGKCGMITPYYYWH